MTGLMICAAVMGLIAVGNMLASLILAVCGDREATYACGGLGLALLAVALWLAYAAGGAA